MENLFVLDRILFHWINSTASNSVFDVIMPWIRNKYNWIPLYLVLLILVIRQFRQRAWIWIFACMLCVGLSDSISSHVIKPIVNRDRPCRSERISSMVIERIGCPPGKSFPSSHAANHFSMAVFLGLVFYSRKSWPLYALVFWAAMICFAQVYVGVHFPSDVLAGAVLGSLISITVFYFSKKFLPLGT